MVLHVWEAARSAKRLDRVVVATVCAGDPPAGEISPYAAGLHARWGMPATADRPPAGDDARAMVAHRRAEDAAEM